MANLVKYSCDKCFKTFSQKSHYVQHINRKKMCNIQTDKIQELINKSVDDKINELNKKLIVNNTIGDNDIKTNNKYIGELNKKIKLMNS